MATLDVVALTAASTLPSDEAMATFSAPDETAALTISERSTDRSTDDKAAERSVSDDACARNTRGIGPVMCQEGVSSTEALSAWLAMVPRGKLDTRCLL